MVKSDWTPPCRISLQKTNENDFSLIVLISTKFDNFSAWLSHLIDGLAIHHMKNGDEHNLEVSKGVSLKAYLAHPNFLTFSDSMKTEELNVAFYLFDLIHVSPFLLILKL